jgi:hypothetical protein
MEHPEISTPTNGPLHEIHSELIGSAFDVLAQLPDLYDKVFAELPDAYNRATAGKFGKIKAVRIPKRGKVFAPFTQRPSDYGVPDGFVLPIVYGLKALMHMKDGRLQWMEDPAAFLTRHLKALAGAFKMPMEMAGFDPQKVAKNETSYSFMVGEVEKSLIKEKAAAE